jgi:hypothetical protein
MTEYYEDLVKVVNAYYRMGKIGEMFESIAEIMFSLWEEEQ